MSDVREKVVAIFHEEFDDDSLEILDSTNADDIDDWDSLANINMLVAMEKEFKVRFPLGEVQRLQNIGDMIKLIEKLINL